MITSKSSNHIAANLSEKTVQALGWSCHNVPGWRLLAEEEHFHEGAYAGGSLPECVTAHSNPVLLEEGRRRYNDGVGYP